MHRPAESLDPEHAPGEHDLTSWHSAAGRRLQTAFDALAERLRSTDLAALLLLGVAAALALGTTWVAGEIYEAVVAGDSVALLDHPTLDWVLGVRTPELNTVIAAFSASGGSLWMSVITGVLVAAMCLGWRRWTPLVLTAIAVAGSLGMTVVGKQLVGRARPPLELSIPPPETSASFPSGHSLNSIVIAGMFCYLLVSHLITLTARAVTVTLTALYTLAMGLSRVYLGHHWLTDVLAAWCLGLAWLTLVITCHRLWVTQHRDHALGRRLADTAG
ncbi:MAG: phosphatase PAP2 family protein [Micropruina sp.]|uniref:phosphatase PAP2 family protein n=1 Tax=Micropruina sp. TaxID=2737536 RepID=UPI0039E2CBC8